MLRSASPLVRTYPLTAIIGYDKPAPEIFHFALAALDVAPGSAVHVGDDDVDVRGAEAAGINPVRIVRESTEASAQFTYPEPVIASLSLRTANHLPSPSPTRRF